MRSLFDRDPSAVGAAVIAVVTAVLTAAGVAADVQGQWIAVANSVVALAVVLWPVRASAYKPSTVDEMLDVANLVHRHGQQR